MITTFSIEIWPNFRKRMLDCWWV